MHRTTGTRPTSVVLALAIAVPMSIGVHARMRAAGTTRAAYAIGQKVRPIDRRRTADDPHRERVDESREKRDVEIRQTLDLKRLTDALESQLAEARESRDQILQKNAIKEAYRKDLGVQVNKKAGDSFERFARQTLDAPHVEQVHLAARLADGTSVRMVADFLVRRDGRFYIVEAKSSQAAHLSENQAVVFEAIGRGEALTVQMTDARSQREPVKALGLEPGLRLKIDAVLVIYENKRDTGDGRVDQGILLTPEQSPLTRWNILNKLRR